MARSVVGQVRQENEDAGGWIDIPERVETVVADVQGQPGAVHMVDGLVEGGRKGCCAVKRACDFVGVARRRRELRVVYVANAGVEPVTAADTPDADCPGLADEGEVPRQARLRARPRRRHHPVTALVNGPSACPASSAKLAGTRTLFPTSSAVSVYVGPVPMLSTSTVFPSPDILCQR